ncbi:hypothetical protein D4R78_02145 [bacterium]|nr:MAG: hypothetical protein D4R78_02145 [bacterium]
MRYSKVITQIFFSVLDNDSQTDTLNRKIAQLSPSGCQELYSFVNASGLLPIFYKRVTGLDFPLRLISQLKSKYYRHLERNLILEQEAWKILEQFRQANILAVPLKGPILAKLLCNDVGLRQSPCDLDFLIKPEAMGSAESALKNAGYESLNEDARGFLRFIKLKYGRQLHFVKKTKKAGHMRIDIDLHCDLRGLFSDTFLDDFWQDVKELSYDGHLVFLPTKESQLLYLSLISFSTFEFVELRYLYDVHKLITKFKTELNWEAILKKATRLRLEAYLWFALKLSRDFFHTEIPQEFLNKLKPPFIKKRILSFWINHDNILFHREKVARSYTWRYFISNCLVRKDFVNILRSVGKKIFLPLKEVAGFYGRPTEKASYSLYLKRLLKPIYRFLH